MIKNIVLVSLMFCFCLSYAQLYWWENRKANIGAIMLQAPYSNDGEINHLEIYNMLGETVANLPLTNGVTTIKMRGQQAGIYMCRVIAETGTLQGQGKFEIAP